MKKIYKNFGFIIFSIIIFIQIIPFTTFKVYATVEETSHVLNVTGKGGVKVKPDIAYISFSVSTKNIVSKTAQSENNSKIIEILKKLKEFKLDDSDINTESYNLTPEYRKIDNYGGKDSIIGYTSSCTIRVSVRDLSKVGAIIDGAIDAGATRVNGLQYTIEEPSIYYSGALLVAGKDARNKAEALAKALDVKIKSVIVIEEQSVNYAPVSYNNTFNETADVAESNPLGTMTMPTHVDTLSVTASIKVTFSIE